MKRLAKTFAAAAALLMVWADPGFAITPSGTYSDWNANTNGAHGKLQWLSVQVDPAPTAGQLYPTYFFSHQVGFDNGVGGYIGIQEDSNGKRAIFSIWDAVSSECSTVAGATCQAFLNECSHAPPCGQQTLIPYNWTAPKNYATYIVRMSPDRWAGYIHDQTANTWTLVGIITVPSGWGDLGWWSVSWIEWYGAHPTTCPGFPDANVYFYPPISYHPAYYSGNSSAQSNGTGTGDHHSRGGCPSSVTNDLPPWKHHIMGV